MLNAQQQQQGPPLNFDQFKKSIEEIESIDEKIDHYLQASVQFSSRIPDSVFALANEVRQMEGLKKAKCSFSTHQNTILCIF